MSDSVRLDIKGLGFTRNDTVLFEDLNFSLKPGEVLQIEGPNGSGKTTLLRILCGLTLPSEGAVCWCGEDIRETLPDYLDDLAYIGHLAGVKEELTPLENLGMAQSMMRPREGADPSLVLERLGLPAEHEDLACRKLSAGQRRRVALGRLLVTDVSLWILDEPFTALDPNGRRMVEQLLTDHAVAGGMAVLTTHHVVRLDDCPVQQLQLGQ